MKRVQSACLLLAVVFGALGLATSTGCPVLPEGSPDLVAPLHGAMLLVGAVFGALLPRRLRGIDEERWRIVEDPDLTSGEREYAHKEADREKKGAGIAFVLAPLALAFWMAYHFREEGAVTSADFLTVTPLVGFAVGFGIAWWRGGGGVKPPGYS